MKLYDFFEVYSIIYDVDLVNQESWIEYQYFINDIIEKLTFNLKNNKFNLYYDYNLNEIYFNDVIETKMLFNNLQITFLFFGSSNKNALGYLNEHNNSYYISIKVKELSSIKNDYNFTNILNIIVKQLEDKNGRILNSIYHELRHFYKKTFAKLNIKLSSNNDEYYNSDSEIDANIAGYISSIINNVFKGNVLPNKKTFVSIVINKITKDGYALKRLNELKLILEKIYDEIKSELEKNGLNKWKWNFTNIKTRILDLLNLFS